jgi:hypothetical protein
MSQPRSPGCAVLEPVRVGPSIARCDVVEHRTRTRAAMTWGEARFAVEINQQEVSGW